MSDRVVHYVKKVGYVYENIVNPPVGDDLNVRDITDWWWIDLWCDSYIQYQVIDGVKYTNNKPDVTCERCLKAMREEK